MDAKVLQGVVEAFPTPLYVFDEGEIDRQVAHLRSLLPEGTYLAYAMKANTFVLERAAADCERIEVCSAGEARSCFALGVPDEKLVISGVHKEAGYIQEFIEEHPGIARYTVESPSQFDLLAQAAEKVGREISILIRLTSGNQFGCTAAEVKELAVRTRELPLVHFAGVQFFSGTQKTSVKRLGREVKKVNKLITSLREEYGMEVEELEFGPGLPVDYYSTEEEMRAQQDELTSALGSLLEDMAFDGLVVLELGRSIAAICGTYATSIVDTKTNKTGNYAIVDGGKHQFVYYSNAMSMRQPPCHAIPARSGAEAEPWNICGSLCTITDILVKQLELVDPQIGDVLYFERAGAYCMTEGISLFLSRDLPTVVLRSPEGALRLARDRMETQPLNTPGALL